MDHVLGEFMRSVARQVMDALLLRPDLGASPTHVEWVSVTLALLVGASILAGQSAVLAINKVRGPSYFFLLLSMGLRVAAIVFCVATVLWVLGLLTGTHVPFTVMAHAVLLAISPGIFAFLVIMPGLGPLLGRVLVAWSFVILWNTTGQMFAVNVAYAFLLSLTAAAITLGVTTVLSGPVGRLRDAAWHRLTGRELRRSSRELLELDGWAE